MKSFYCVAALTTVMLVTGCGGLKNPGSSSGDSNSNIVRSTSSGSDNSGIVITTEAPVTKVSFTGKTVTLPSGGEAYSTDWVCRLGERYSINFEKSNNSDKKAYLSFVGKDYVLIKEQSVTGTPVYSDAKSGVKLVVSQDEKGLKSMLVNQKKGMPLAMDCYSKDVASSVF